MRRSRPLQGESKSRHVADDVRVKIGLDLDNTLIHYDDLFVRVAREGGLVPPTFVGSKRDVRDFVRLLPDGEIRWQELQAEVYGPAIGGASAAAGALEFIRLARRRGAQLAIVSHKSTYSNLGRSQVDLREAASAWLRTSGIIGPDAIAERDLYFESTRDEKIARISALGFTHFIDDLEEIFEHPAFPEGVTRMLFTTANMPPGPYDVYASFHEISRVLIPA
jgi:hypothetical protein